jgi:Ni/Fe-hydrogenase subunit HybB-like protein
MQTNDMIKGQSFKFTTRHKIIFALLILIGLGSLIWTLMNRSSGQLMSSLLLNNTLFLTIALGAVIFLAAHTISKANWYLSLSRVAEASGMFLPIAAILMLILFLWAEQILPWTGEEHTDPVLEAKRPYLNLPFFIIRQVVILGIWVWLTIRLRKLSINADQQITDSFIRKSRITSALFLVFTFIVVAVFSWDWMMSLEPHWYSTLYGWYVLSGALLKGVAIVILVGGMLKSMGYLDFINKEHLHDFGKYLFGFSVFWMYLWYSQFMLIWYGNLPEETIYYFKRIQHYEILFILNVILNFALPFILLLDRSMRRRWFPLVLTAFIVLIGQWVDHYLLVFPGITGEEGALGIADIGISLGYIGLFLWIVFYYLSKANLIPVNHPNLKEGFHYENI